MESPSSLERIAGASRLDVRTRGRAASEADGALGTAPAARTATSRCFFIGSGWGDGALAAHLRALAAELAGRGHRVVMLLHGEMREGDTTVLEGNPLVLRWPSKRPTHMKDAVFLYRLVRRHKPDCFISSFAAANVMILVGRATGVPCIVDWYQTLTEQIAIDWTLPRWKRHLLQFRKRLVYRGVHHIIPVSEAARRDAARAYGIAASKCQVFYNSLAEPDPNGLQEGEPTRDKLVCVGRLNTSKGQDVLIRAIAALKTDLPSLRVEFVGTGAAKDDYQQLAADLGITGQCRFRGPASRAQILAEMKSAVATVVPSRSDNCPLVIIESLAVGTPVIASGVGGIVEMIRDGIEGRVVPPDDPDALAAALREIVTAPDRRATLSRNARQRFLEAFELGRSVRQQATWFEGAVARSVRA